MTSAPRRQPALPALLDPILALVERVDRRRRGVRPVLPGGLLGIEDRRHRGPELRLADGVVVRRGAPVWTIHFDNARLGLLGTQGWQRPAYAVARAELQVLAGDLREMDPSRRPVALTGVTLLAALAVRAGFEARERRRTPWVGLEDRYLRSLLARWSPAGRSRLERGNHPLRSHELWLSAPELLRRYGPAHVPPDPPP